MHDKRVTLWMHTLSQTSININWAIQPVSMLCKPNISSQIFCTEACLDRNSNNLELVQWGFQSWGTQKNLSPNSFATGKCFRAFWGIFPPECNKLETVCNLGVISAVKKRYIFFLNKYCHSISWTMTTNSYCKKNVLNFVENLLVFAIADLKLC